MLAVRPGTPAEVENASGAHVVALRNTDRGLASFCGVPSRERALSHDWWLDELRRRRNLAVDDAITQVLRQRAPDGRVGDFARESKQVEDDSLPRIVTVHMPECVVDDTRMHGVDMRVLVDRNPNKVVKVEATTENFSYIREAVRASRSDDPVRQRRAAGERVRTDTKHVYYNYARGALIARYVDGEGRQRSRSAKVKPSQDVAGEARALRESLPEPSGAPRSLAPLQQQ